MTDKEGKKRKSKEQRQKGQTTPEALGKKEGKTSINVSTPEKLDDVMKATPAGKQRKKEDGALTDLKVEEQQADKTDEPPSDGVATIEKLAEEVKGLKEASKEQGADKKCCKCTQGRCLSCQCYKNQRWCGTTCKSPTCANQDNPNRIGR